MFHLYLKWSTASFDQRPVLSLSNKDAEVNKERNEIEKFKRTLQRQLQDLQFDLEKQRTELKTEFDEIQRKREHEWRMQTDEFSTELLAKELQVGDPICEPLVSPRWSLSIVLDLSDQDDFERA